MNDLQMKVGHGHWENPTRLDDNTLAFLESVFKHDPLAEVTIVFHHESSIAFRKENGRGSL